VNIPLYKNTTKMSIQQKSQFVNTFCLVVSYLYEVEVALDEAHTMHFTKIFDELSTTSQFILITHNRATMHTATHSMV